jgi:hypothetical protein
VPFDCAQKSASQQLGVVLLARMIAC